VKRWALLVAVLLAACASSPKSQFYTLSASESAAAPGAPAYIVAVGPVTIPESVDRPQFVLRVSTHEVEIAEQARWAEPLKSAIPRVIAADLAYALGDARVSVYGRGAAEEADIRVLVQIERFDSLPGDAAVIEAAWTVRPAKGPAWSGRSVLREAVPGKDYESLAGAHSRALAALSGDILRIIRALRAR